MPDLWRIAQGRDPSVTFSLGFNTRVRGSQPGFSPGADVHSCPRGEKMDALYDPSATESSLSFYPPWERNFLQIL